MKKKLKNQVKVHTFLGCTYNFQDFAQTQENFAQLHDRETVTFKNSAVHLHTVHNMYTLLFMYTVYTMNNLTQLYAFTIDYGILKALQYLEPTMVQLNTEPHNWAVFISFSFFIYIKHSAVQCSAVQYSALQYGAVQYSQTWKMLGS